MYAWVLFLHILCATVWVGGHIVLSLAVLPMALREKDEKILLAFESKFEKIGMPALIIQVVAGMWLVHNLLPDVSLWFAWDRVGRLAVLISIKLALMIATVLLAIDARCRLIPNLSAQTLPKMARRVWLVTLIAVGFVAVGVFFRAPLW